MLSIYFVTFRQLLRQSILWWICVAVVIMSEVMPSFAEVVAFGHVEQAVISSAQGVLWLGVLCSILLSSHYVLGKELEEKVALTIFTKPISAFSFLMGKFFALLTFNSVIFVIQVLCVLKTGWVYEWSLEGYVMFFHSIWMVFCQGIIFLGLTVFCCCCFSPFLAPLLACCLWLLATFVPSTLAWLVSPLLPYWSAYDISFNIFHKVPVSASDTLLLTAYALACLFLSVYAGACALDHREY